MLRSVKQVGQALLAAAAGAVLSFSATQMLSTPQPESIGDVCESYTCNERCLAGGYEGGECLKGGCFCYM